MARGLPEAFRELIARVGQGARVNPQAERYPWVMSLPMKVNADG
jgi:hypothetical protein